ncbi:hypothetical protein SDC9_189402 [bioreactor metagenome]|uniref:Uncharacterized protein n=1 Tax=bioreactor metagenome TaxID=1076179 RepID=A0A645HSD3_9ZZZZ
MPVALPDNRLRGHVQDNLWRGFFKSAVQPLKITDIAAQGAHARFDLAKREEIRIRWRFKRITGQIYACAKEQATHPRALKACMSG